MLTRDAQEKTMTLISTKQRVKIIDLFSGGGGLSLGAHLAGFVTDKAVEIDPNLSLSFKANFPEAQVFCRDINDIDPESLRMSEPFGIIGGPPCQGFSAIGKMREFDPRRTLISAFCEKVEQLSPAFFVFENVTGLLFEKNISVLEAALDKIPSHYNIMSPIVLNAADYGIPTDRRRVFIIGYNPDLVNSISSDNFSAKKVAKRATVKDAFEGLKSADMVGEEDGYDKWRISDRSFGPYARQLVALDLTFTGNRRTRHTAEVQQRFSSLKQGETDPIGRHKRLSWDGLCPTLRAGTGSDKGSFQSVRPLHPEEPRVITVREAARLQSFPDNHLFHPTIWHSFRMIGNSVPPNLAKAVLETIGEAMQ